ncbi:hypothetical protein EWM64_g5982 [Hericium alpestre]|uniref:Uncharacterized protein n=1 Tax=Hericium alpestre TaxID=135208 RepID=A0A4Y9ZV48_9AGAM|nr:hypothetical protein EWM64_g5982 [Hericium alpestre]
MTEFDDEDRAPSDDAWEDVDDSHNIRSRYQSAPPFAPASPDSFSVTSEGTGSLRRRSKKQRGVVAYQTASVRRPQTPSRLVRRVPPPDKPQNGIGKEDLQDALSSGVVHASLYTADVLGTVIRLMKRPLAIFLFFWLLAYMLGRMSSAIRTTLSPLCIIPGVSRICYAPPPDAARTPQWADYPRLMEMQGQTLETLLEEKDALVAAFASALRAAEDAHRAGAA